MLKGLGTGELRSGTITGMTINESDNQNALRGAV